MSTPRRATVVITGSGTVTCQSVIKALRSQDEIPVEIVTVDASPQVAGRYFSDNFYTVPPAADADFVPVVLDVCRRHNANLLIPIVDYEFRPLSSAVGLFDAIGCLLAVSPPEVIERVNNKLQTYRFFVDNGFPTAQTWDADAARRDMRDLPYPVFLKPAIDGRSSIDCYTVENPSDLELHLNRLPNVLVQEFISGPEFTADILADWQSEVLGLVIRERIETKGGVSYKGRTVVQPSMEEHVLRMAPLLGLRGPANIQAFVTDGGVIFNEVNPRFSGALALSLAAGLNSPLLLLKLALGLPVQSCLAAARAGLTMLRYWDEVFVDADGRAEYPEYRLVPRLGALGV